MSASGPSGPLVSFLVNLGARVIHVINFLISASTLDFGTYPMGLDKHNFSA